MDNNVCVLVFTFYLPPTHVGMICIVCGKCEIKVEEGRVTFRTTVRRVDRKMYMVRRRNSGTFVKRF